MKYSSTRGKERSISFENVLLNGLATDGGLYVPNKIPKLNKAEILKLSGLEYYEPVSYTHLTLPTTPYV